MLSARIGSLRVLSEPHDRLAIVIQRLSLPATLQSLDVSPSGKLSYTCEDSERTLARTDGSSLELPRSEDHFFYSSLASQDGETLFLTDAHARRLVAVRDDTEAWEVPSQTTQGNLHPLQETPEGDVFFSGATFGALISKTGQPHWVQHSQHHQSYTGHCSLFFEQKAYLGGVGGLEQLGGWFTPSPDRHVISELAADRGVLYASAFGPERGLLVAYDADDGHELWRRETGFNRAMVPVVQKDGSIIAADQEGRIQCFERDGQPRWSRHLSDITDLFAEPVRQEGAPTSPALDGQGNVYIGWGTTLLCFEGQTGKPKGRMELPAAQAACQQPQIAQDGTVYVHDGQQSILAINMPELLEDHPNATIKVERDQVTVGTIRLPVKRKAPAQ